MIRLGLALLLAAPLAAESHWTLRHQSALLGRDASNLVLGHEESLRLHGGADASAWRAEWNLLGRAISLSNDALLPTSLALPDRSRALQGEQRSTGLLLGLEADQLSLRWQGEQAAAVLGRQSVNLGENFFFSPLDLFAPFSPQEAYRDFRAGVDALRLSWSPSAYSLLEAVAVAGWKPSPAGSTLPDCLDADGPQSQSSLLLRGQANGERWSLTALGGRFRDQAIGGGAMQLEFWGASWGAEGVWRTSLERSLDPSWGQIETHAPAWTYSHSRQWSPWLSSRIEHNVEVQYELTEQGYLGNLQIRPQYALGLQAQAGPLWNLGATVLAGANARDNGLTAQLSAQHSLSDDSQLGLTVVLPIRWPSQGVVANPNYGAQFELRTTL
jgi:hypothetical protein